jgi:hypothetical protein
MYRMQVMQVALQASADGPACILELFDRSQMDTVSCTCMIAVWVSSHIVSAASLKSGRSTPTSCETSTQQILVRSPVSLLKESLEVYLMGFLAVYLVRLMSLLQKNPMYLSKVESVRSADQPMVSADQPMVLVDASSTGLRQPIDLEASTLLA